MLRLQEVMTSRELVEDSWESHPCGVWKTMGGWNEQQNPQKVEGSLLKAWDSDLPEWVTGSAAIY